MEALRDNDEKVQCPYESAHYIRKCRLEVHLKKCRKVHPESANFGICIFNAAHRIPKIELDVHHCICPNMKDVEMLLLTPEGKTPSVPPLPSGPPVPVDTSWDTDAEVPTYDPQKYCEANPILRRIDTESASTRREFRNSERRRFNDLEERASKPSTSIDNKASTSSGKVQLPPIPVSDVSTIVEPTPDSVLKLFEKTSTRPKGPAKPTTNKKK